MSNMDYERRKQKYFDKLKKMTLQRFQNDNGVLDIQNDNSTCFNDSNRQYVEPKFEPNDLLAKIECYIRANPTSHITKGRLTVERDLCQRGFRSNIQNKNDLDMVRINCRVQDKVNSFIKPKRRLVNYEPESKIKISPPNATSTIKNRQTFPPKNDKPKYKFENNNKYSTSKSNCSSSSSSSGIVSFNIINRNTREIRSKQLDQEIKKYKNVDEKVESALISSLYMQFVLSQCNEIKSISSHVYPNNNYGLRLKKKLLQIKLKHQNKQDEQNTNSICSPELTTYDSFMNISPETTSSYNNFIFKPVIKLSNISDECRSQLFEDSFVDSTREFGDSMNIGQVETESNDEYFSSPKMYSNGSNGSDRYHSRSTHLTSFDLSPKKSIQMSNTDEESNSEDSFKYYRNKMF